ncbi:hypothetical protein C3489_21815 [Streptomyces sp. Ru71]|nr:hypothetical protein C3489_21815 [Streptomyces sp. Ru71]
MAFMAPILAHGVAASSRSGYSARPDRLGHHAYGIEHMPYHPSTPAAHRDERDTAHRAPPRRTDRPVPA